jgi:hypothetical protein
MTEFVIELLRLRGDERWADWGDQWWDHAEILGELPPKDPGGWQLIDHFRSLGLKGTQLDWGSLLYPITKQELIALYSATAELRPRQGSESGPSGLSELAEDDNYGLVVVEC